MCSGNIKAAVEKTFPFTLQQQKKHRSELSKITNLKHNVIEVTATLINHMRSGGEPEHTVRKKQSPHNTVYYLKE